jgi:hypothetical protein
MPDVKDHDHPQVVGFVCRFVLNRVVENPGSATLPRPNLFSDPKPAFARNDQRQMAQQPEIRDPDVRWN